MAAYVATLNKEAVMAEAKKEVDTLAIVKGKLVSPAAYAANASKVRKAAKLAKAKK